MRTLLYIALIAPFGLAACKGSDNSKQSAKASTQSAASDDPWAKKSGADIKDPKLGRLVELANNGPTKREYPQPHAIVALRHDDISY